MGRIDDALRTLEQIDDKTERAFQLAGLLSTVFKLRGVALVVTGQLAFDSYANATSDAPEIDVAVFSGKLEPRVVLEVMHTQLHAKGAISHWTVSGIPIRFTGEAVITHRDLCRDFTTDNGVVKLLPVEEITADRILAAFYPTVDYDAHAQARLLLINGLSEAFHMDWLVLQDLCHRPSYRVGEELAQLRQSAKKDVDAIGAAPDPLAHHEVAPAEKPLTQTSTRKLPPIDDLTSLY